MSQECAIPEESFSQLCQRLIDEEEHHYLHPIVERFRSTDWVAKILTHHDEARAKQIAFGQAQTMEEACSLCVTDYHEKARIEARKEELKKEPLVREALTLFGYKEEGGDQ